jgi:hypothetical protein
LFYCSTALPLPGIFIPVKVFLSKVFRGLLCQLHEQAVTAGDINLPDVQHLDFILISRRFFNQSKSKYIV